VTTTSVRRFLEYCAFRVLAGCLSVLPYRVALTLGCSLAWVAFNVAGSRARQAIERILGVFGSGMSPQQARKIAWVSFRNLVFSAIDMVWLHRFTLQDIDSSFEAPGDIKAFRGKVDFSRGAVLATPHMGSWELAALACHLYVAPLCVISARHHNTRIARYFAQLRSGFGIDTLVRGTGIIGDTLERLRRGRALAIMPDVRMPRPDVTVQFLGGTANVSRGMALFAKIAGVPICPCVITRVGWTRHRVKFHPPVMPDKHLDKETDIRRMTAHVMNIIEQAIREEPSQWFWFNKRWILDPVGAESGGTREEPEGGEEE